MIHHQTTVAKPLAPISCPPSLRSGSHVAGRLLHHPDDYFKILTTPSTPPLTSSGSYALLVGL